MEEDCFYFWPRANKATLHTENYCLFKNRVKAFQTRLPAGDDAAQTRRGRRGRERGFHAALTHLADIHLVSVFARGGAVGGEDGGAVAVRVPVDHADGVVESLGLQDDQHRPEDLLGVALHCGLRGHDGHTFTKC